MRPTPSNIASLTAARFGHIGGRPGSAATTQSAAGYRIHRGKESDAPAKPTDRADLQPDSLLQVSEQLGGDVDSVGPPEALARHRWQAVRVALENMTAADSANEDPLFALEVAGLSKARILSIITAHRRSGSA